MQSLVQNKHFNVPTNAEDHQWAGTSDPEIRRFADIQREGRLFNPVKRRGEADFTNLSWYAIPQAAQAGAGATFDFILVSEELSTANCVKIAENLGHTEYDGRSCVVQTGFYGSDHCPVVLTFEPYWIARLEAHKKVLQAIAATDFVDVEALFDADDSDDDMAPATYDVHDEASTKVPIYVKKAKSKQHREPAGSLFTLLPRIPLYSIT